MFPVMLEAGDPAGPAQEIVFPWAKQAVETIRVVCLALDDLVTTRLKELTQQAAAVHSVVYHFRDDHPRDSAHPILRSTHFAKSYSGGDPQPAASL